MNFNETYNPVDEDQVKPSYAVWEENSGRCLTAKGLEHEHGYGALYNTSGLSDELTELIVAFQDLPATQKPLFVNYSKRGLIPTGSSLAKQMEALAKENRPIEGFVPEHQRP